MKQLSVLKCFKKRALPATDLRVIFENLAYFAKPRNFWLLAHVQINFSAENDSSFRFEQVRRLSKVSIFIKIKNLKSSKFAKPQPKVVRTKLLIRKTRVHCTNFSISATKHIAIGTFSDCEHYLAIFFEKIILTNFESNVLISTRKCQPIQSFQISIFSSSVNQSPVTIFR